MTPHIRVPRPQRTVRAARPLVLVRTGIRSKAPISGRGSAELPFAGAVAASFEPDPYVDYGRYLTPEGGVLFIYKDIDTRLRHTLWRLFAWTASTGAEGWHVLHS